MSLALINLPLTRVSVGGFGIASRFGVDSETHRAESCTQLRSPNFSPNLIVHDMHAMSRKPHALRQIALPRSFQSRIISQAFTQPLQGRDQRLKSARCLCWASWLSESLRGPFDSAGEGRYTTFGYTGVMVREEYSGYHRLPIQIDPRQIPTRNS